jgi:two-component system, NtrC family, response regulator AtoC
VKGKFELADHGTLFLDEVGDMPLSLQVKLLRVLQEQRFTRVGGEKEISVDVRVIAATNRDLEEAVKLKMFREDLFYRLNVIPIHLPALRERREDVPQLVEYFLNRFAKRHGMPRLHLNESQMDALMEYPWPGNIRELQNSVEKATVLQDVGSLLQNTSGPRSIAIPATTRKGEGAAPTTTMSSDEYILKLGESDEVRDLSEVAADAQRAAVIRALKICRGNKADAARKLGVSYKTLFNKIDDLKIEISTNVK